MSCLAIQTKATFPTQSAHHGTSGKWKPRPFPCCVVNPLACLEPSTALVTFNHGARARHSLSGPPNASSTPLTKSFEQAIPESEACTKSVGWPTPGWPGAPPFTKTASWHPSICFYTAIGSHICRPAKNSWQAACLHPVRLGACHFYMIFPSITPPRFAGEPHPRLGSHICRPVKNSWQSSCFSARRQSA